MISFKSLGLESKLKAEGVTLYAVMLKERLLSQGLLSLFLVIAITLVLLNLFTPYWETNDDIAMSMIAGGYGFVDYSSPYLKFSNVLWGEIVSRVPAVNGVRGYSVMTMLVTVLSLWVFFYCLLRLGFGYKLAFLVVSLVAIRPILSPQFTVNAGLVATAGFFLLLLYDKLEKYWLLIFGVALAFLGFLVRWEEFFLIAAVVSPILLRKAVANRILQVGLGILVVLVSSAAFYDSKRISGDEFLYTNEFLSAVQPIINYHEASLMKQEPPSFFEELSYSRNDLEMLEAWFFFDEDITNPETLRELHLKLAQQGKGKGSVKSGWLAVKSFLDRSLFPLMLLALILFLLNPTWNLFASWMIVFVAIFAIGFLGRPGILRIYYPLATLLCLAPFVYYSSWEKSFTKLYVAAASVLVVFVSFNVAVFNNKDILSKEVRAEYANLPTDEVFVVGAQLPFEALYPVLGTNEYLENLEIYWSASFLNAPFSNHTVSSAQAGENYFKQRLQSDTGLYLMADSRHLRLLSIYCKEHLSRSLNVHEEITFKTLGRQLQRVSCRGNS